MNYETPVVPAHDAEEQGSWRRPSRRRTIIIAAIAAVVIAVALWIATRPAAPSPEDAVTGNASAGESPIVTVVVPGQRTVDRIVAATGSLAAKRDMPISVVGEGGMVSRVLVEPGAWVRAGQALAVIERSVQVEQVRSLSAQVSVAQADADLAQANLTRAQALVSRGFISKAEIDRLTATRDAAVARVAVAKAQLGEQRARVGRLDIRAPESGLILTRAVEPGQVVAAGGATLFRMAQDGEMEMRAQVSEADLARIRVGNRVKVTPVGSARTFDGRVWQVAPVVDPTSRLGTVRILLRYDPALRPGGFAQAQLVSGTAQAPMLPESAVLSDDKGNYVLVVGGNGRVARRDITIGQVSAEGVAIASGLNGTEQVVRSAGAFLNPGEKVRTNRAPRS